MSALETRLRYRRDLSSTAAAHFWHGLSPACSRRCYVNRSMDHSDGLSPEQLQQKTVAHETTIIIHRPLYTSKATRRAGWSKRCGKSRASSLDRRQRVEQRPAQFAVTSNQFTPSLHLSFRPDLNFSSCAPRTPSQELWKASLRTTTTLPYLDYPAAPRRTLTKRRPFVDYTASPSSQPGDIALTALLARLEPILDATSLPTVNVCPLFQCNGS